MIRLLFSAMILILSSCQVYKSHFDCPPGEGVPCTSVHQIEEMIVESEDGPNLFVKTEMDSGSEIVKKRTGKLHVKQKRVWVQPHCDEDGVFVEGYFVYLPEN